jgi:hypothetical protein
MGFGLFTWASRELHIGFRDGPAHPIELGFSEPAVELAPHLILGRITTQFVAELEKAGLEESRELADGQSVFIEFRGTNLTSDLMRPNAVATALILSSDLRVFPAVQIIVQLGEQGFATGSRFPRNLTPIRWGHYRSELSRADITTALRIWRGVEKVQIRDEYHRVGNALRFYENAYTSDNADIALVGFTTCLEGLFSTVEQEISFRLALRLAHFLGESIEDKRKKYAECREAYKVRSKIVHGARIMREEEATAIYLVEGIVPIGERLARSALRKIFELQLETFFDSSRKVEALFEELLFSECLDDALKKINR